jgi:hypothetical protein
MLADLSGWRARAAPDLRFTRQQPQDSLTFLPESPIRREGDRLVQSLTATFKLRLTNLSPTAGFVDRVELVPATSDVGSIEEILSITRREISRDQPQMVEVTARIRTPVEAAGPTEEERIHEYFVRPFDDRGRLIERYDNDLYARIRFIGRHALRRQSIPPR